MYAVNHSEFVARPWHVFVVYIIVTWIACLLVCFANKLMPMVTNLGIFFIIVGVLVSIIVLAVMPGRNGGRGHASNSFVWSEWSSQLGYPQGFVFMLGMLNGAYGVGTPDVTTHLAEEIPNPHINIPKAIAAQIIVGFITAFAYLIALLYAISDYNALFTSPFPIATIYHQATGSNAGTVGLLVCIFFPILCTLIGCYLTAGRMFWSLARDGASPFSHFFSQVSPGLHMPFRATIACCTMITILGAIYVGSVTAFNAFVGVFVIMSTSSYTAAILPHLITRRSNIIPGPFWMKGWIGFVVNAVACSYMIVFIVIYSFPYYLPTDAQTMNYACLMYGGLTIFVTVWWFIGARKGYKGPQSIGGITEADMIKGQVRASTTRV
jgi:choline transport protein